MSMCAMTEGLLSDTPLQTLMDGNFCASSELRSEDLCSVKRSLEPSGMNSTTEELSSNQAGAVSKANIFS